MKNIDAKPPRNESTFEELLIKKETAAPKKTVVSATQAKPSQVKTRPKRQSAKKANDKLTDIFDEENMKDDEKITTTFRDFKAQQKKMDSGETKTTKSKDSQDSNRNYYLEPVEIITRTTLKSRTTKFNKYESKPKHYDTEEENREVKRLERALKKETKKKVEPKVQRPKTERKVKEPVERKPLASFDLNKNDANPKSAIAKDQKPTLKQLQKLKFPEIHEKLSMDDDMDMELETSAPVKAVEQLNDKFKVSSDDSINSGRSPTPEISKKNDANVKTDTKLTIVKDQKPTLKQLQKRKFPEIHGKSAIDDDIDMKTTAPVKAAAKQSNDKFKVSSDEYQSPSPTPEISKKKSSGKRLMEDDKKEIRTEKRRRLTIDNVFEFCGSDKEPPKLAEVTSRVEEWLKSASDSFSFNVSGDNDDPENPVQNDVVTKDVQNTEVDENESEDSFGQFANDEHQHYSSSSHESMDLDVKNVPKQKQKLAVAASTVIEKTPKVEYQSTSRHVTDASQNNNNLIMDPCQTFKIRCSEAVVELNMRKKKIDDSDKAFFKKFDQPISKYGKKCLDQVHKTKAQLQHVNQLHLRYESAKSKLMDDLTEQEKMFQILKREIAKRTDAMEIRNQSKQKELINLKIEALRKNEELLQDVWREYINNFQSSLNNSIQKAYEI
jgi:hypothetical protein